jgi:hypothetical protein
VRIWLLEEVTAEDRSFIILVIPVGALQFLEACVDGIAAPRSPFNLFQYLRLMTSPFQALRCYLEDL